MLHLVLVYSHAAFVVQCTACPLARLPFLNGTECIAACPALVQQGVCTSMCTPGFFADRQQCVECDETCRTCTGGGHLQCTSCNPGRFLLNGECRSCSGCTVRYDVSPAEADACLLSMLHLFDPLKVQAPDVALTASAVAAGSVMRTIRNACVLQIMSATSAN